MWPMPLVGELRPFKPCLKAYTVSLPTNAFGRQVYWDMVPGKNEHLNSFMCPCLFLVLMSADISICLFGTFAIPLLFYMA